MFEEILQFENSPPLVVAVLWIVKVLVVLTFQHKHSLALAARKRGFELRKSPLSLDSLQNGQPEVVCARVCVQIPVYNEPTHVVAAIECAGALEWPDSQLEIQVLDDSCDQTSRLVQEALSRLRQRRPGLVAHHVQREGRAGFKAGALNHGLQMSDADFFAVFDCDFRPQPSFLRECFPHFEKGVACVQAGWSYTNSSESFLTRLQSLLLNTHFYMEHAGRSVKDYVFNFNGTAGVWRGEVLRTVGGWSDHSVTEDLYLSYQTYLSGWRLVFAHGVHCDSELPNDLPSFLVQQRRWAKGNGQVLRLMGKRLLKYRDWSWIKRGDVFFHLLGYSLTTLVLAMMAISPLWIAERGDWVAQSSAWEFWRLFDVLVWGSLWIALVGVYTSPEAHCEKNAPLPTRLLRALGLLFSAPLISFLLFRSYWEGVLLKPRGKQLVFHRTPKSRARRWVGQFDALVAVFLATSAFLLSYSAFEQSFYFGALVFLLHAGATLFLWLKFGSGLIAPDSPTASPVEAEGSALSGSSSP